MSESIDSQLLVLAKAPAKFGVKPVQTEGYGRTGEGNGFAAVLDEQRSRPADPAPDERRSKSVGGNDRPGERQDNAAEATSAGRTGGAEAAVGRGGDDDREDSSENGRRTATDSPDEAATAGVGQDAAAASATARGPSASGDALRGASPAPGSAGQEGLLESAPPGLAPGGSAAAASQPSTLPEEGVGGARPASGSYGAAGFGDPGAVRGSPDESMAQGAPLAELSRIPSGQEAAGLAVTEPSAAAGQSSDASPVSRRAGPGLANVALASDAAELRAAVTPGLATNASPVSAAAGSDSGVSVPTLEAALVEGDDGLRAGAVPRGDGAISLSLPAAAGMTPASSAATSQAAATTSVDGEALVYDMEASPDDADFPREMSSRMSVMLRDGNREARLQLHPAELGRVQVTINTDGDQARVVFVAESAGAREAIEQAMPRLREALAQQGMDLAQADVGQQGPSEDRSAQRDGSARTRSGDVDGQIPDAASGEDSSVTLGVISRLDLYA